MPIVNAGYGQNFDYGNSPYYKDDGGYLFDFMAVPVTGPAQLKTQFSVVFQEAVPPQP
jgi:hypothetical protein